MCALRNGLVAPAFIASVASSPGCVVYCPGHLPSLVVLLSGCVHLTCLRARPRAVAIPAPQPYIPVKTYGSGSQVPAQRRPGVRDAGPPLGRHLDRRSIPSPAARAVRPLSATSVVTAGWLNWARWKRRCRVKIKLLVSGSRPCSPWEVRR